MIRTLIIDDEALARARIQRLIGYYPDFQVVGQASNGREGLRLIQSMVPDLLFLDIQMPDMNGFDFFESIKKMDPFVQVIFLTGNANIDYIKKAFKNNAFEFFKKPVSDNNMLINAFEKASTHYENQNNSQLSNSMENEIQSIPHPNNSITLIFPTISNFPLPNTKKIFRYIKLPLKINFILSTIISTNISIKKKPK